MKVHVHSHSTVGRSLNRRAGGVPAGLHRGSIGKYSRFRQAGEQGTDDGNGEENTQHSKLPATMCVFHGPFLSLVCRSWGLYCVCFHGPFSLSSVEAGDYVCVFTGLFSLSSVEAGDYVCVFTGLFLSLVCRSTIKCWPPPPPNCAPWSQPAGAAAAAGRAAGRAS